MRKAYRVNKVKEGEEGVYHVIGTGALTVVGNSPVIGRRGGRDIKKDAAKPPLMERTGWSGMGLV